MILISHGNIDNGLQLFRFISQPNIIEQLEYSPKWALSMREKLKEIIQNDRLTSENKYAFALCAVNIFDDIPWFIQKILYQNEGDNCRHLSTLFSSFIREERDKVLTRIDKALKFEEIEILNIVGQYSV